MKFFPLRSLLEFSMIILILLVAAGHTLNAQAHVHPAGDTGQRFIQNFSFRDYNAYSENWDIVQDRQGIIYAANGKGILAYDGVSWRLTESESVYSLAVDGNGVVYVSMFGDFGYLEAEASGQTRFVSLLDKSSGEYDNLLGRRLLARPEGIYCASREFILRWSPRGLRKWHPKSWFGSIFFLHQQIYVYAGEVGLMRLENDSLQLAPGGEFFADAGVSVMLPSEIDGDTTAILIGTHSRGLFLYDGSSIRPFPAAVNDFLKDNELSCGVQLRDRTYLLGTQRGGAVRIDRRGNILEILNEAGGIRNDEVQAIYPDRQGGLWLALYDGISRVELPSRWSFFDEASGIQSDVSAVQRHRGGLYLIGRFGRYRGIYSLSPKSMVPEQNGQISQFGFSHLADIKTNAWALLSAGKDLLAATDEGVYQIRDSKATLLPGNRVYTQSLCRSQQDSNRVYVGLGDGLAVLERVRGQWVSRGRLAATDAEVAHIVEDRDGVLWLETWAGDIWRVSDRRGGEFRDPAAITAEQFDTRNGLPAEYAYVSTVRGRALFPTSAGLRRYDPATQTFPPDSTFGAAYADTTREIQYVVEDLQGHVWLYSLHRDEVHLAAAVLQEDGTYRIEETPLLPLASLGDIVYHIYPEASGITWFGTSEGLFRYDPAIAMNYALDYPALIRRVSVTAQEGDSIIYYGGTPFEKLQKKEGAPAVLVYRNNAIHFEFAATYFDARGANRYQSKLEGFEKKWSEWKKESQKDYTNIPEGNYTFRVRARNLYGHISSEGAYAFRVLPPWYRTWWSYILYAGAFFLASWGISRVRNRQLQARSRVLEGKVRERTREIRQQAEEIRQQAEELQEKNDELIRTREKLVVQEKLASLGSLTAGIAHEIKNPLNFVNNFAGLSIDLVDDLRKEMDALTSGKADAETVAYAEELMRDLQMNVTKINEHGRRADNIIQDMLKHSQGVAGKSARVKINDLVDEYVNVAYHSFKAQHPGITITLEKDYADDSGELEVQPQDLSRAIVNIVDNACYAATDKQKRRGNDFMPTLSVRTLRVDHFVEIRVRDNGEGIPDKVREKIFNPFYTTKPAGEGTGLGLSLTYDIIVKVHEGEIKVETEAGEFTEFILRLPGA